LTIIRLGKAREATGFTAEKYKAAIRKYMEAMGYAQTTDSSLEGHPADMIFMPQASRPWPEVWVEAKATELTLSDSGFADEVRGYLRQWLTRIASSRFRLMIFAKKLVNVSRWELVWGNTLSQPEVVRWLTAKLDDTSASYFTEATTLKEALSFFSETSVVEGSDVDLIDTAEQKRKVAMSANEIRRRALHQLSLMEQRSKPIPKKSALVANLISFVPPKSYAVLEIDRLSTTEVQNLMRRRESPPYAMLETGKLLTFGTQESESSFDVLRPQRLRTITLKQLEQEFPAKLSQLINYAIGKLLRPLGVSSWGQRYYFLAERQVMKGENRVIALASGETMQVARPLYLQEKKDGFVAEDAGQTRLNFVFHQAFSLRYRSLWDQHFIQIRLGKLFTKDGITVIEGRSASKIDERFRNPIFDRSETRQRKMEKLVGYVFNTDRPSFPNWARLISFGDFLRFPTSWAPDAVPIDQTMIDDFEEEEAQDDN